MFDHTHTPDDGATGAETRAPRYPGKRHTRFPHIVSISGGKDSTATYLMALERGMPFRAVFADTGHEHPDTYAYVMGLADRTGGPEVEVVRADFTDQLATRRRNLPALWTRHGIAASVIEDALGLLHPTGNPFLDLCLLKGRFPSARARFCTEKLKAQPIEDQVILPALVEHRGVVSWQGERREESPARSNLPMVQRVRWSDPRGMRAIFRPLVHATAADVFAIHDRHGLPPNPLYRAGMGRVGCMPCIMCSKHELREIANRFPAALARVRDWERLVASASKRGTATFFAADKTPVGRELIARLKRRAARWAETDSGGRQLPLAFDEGTACTSHYGLCE